MVLKTLIHYGKLWYYGKNYGAMDKTMVLWIKLCYCSENYETSIYEGKNMVDYQKLRNFDLKRKKTMEIYQKYFKFYNKFLALELDFP